MKSNILKIIIIVFFSVVTMATTCYEPYEPYSLYSPILMHRDVLENSISFGSARDLINPGKIYLKGDTIYINEKYKGIHVINNQDPQNPQKIGFIIIPGCIDLAVKSNIIYADNAVDLVSIKLSSNLEDIEVTGRQRDVFPELTAPDRRSLGYEYYKGNRPENTIIVGWEISH